MSRPADGNAPLVPEAVGNGGRAILPRGPPGAQARRAPWRRVSIVAAVLVTAALAACSAPERRGRADPPPVTAPKAAPVPAAPAAPITSASLAQSPDGAIVKQDSFFMGPIRISGTVRLRKIAGKDHLIYTYEYQNWSSKPVNVASPRRAFEERMKKRKGWTMKTAADAADFKLEPGDIKIFEFDVLPPQGQLVRP